MRRILLLLSLCLLLAACQPAQPTPDPDQDAALDTVLTFYQLLNAGNYEQAAALYAGDYAMLVEWNPHVDSTDYAQLLRQACTVNGLFCLRVKTARFDSLQPDGSYRFLVQFEMPDGSLFSTGPEGTTPVFEFSATAVKTSGDTWQILELPPYGG